MADSAGVETFQSKNVTDANTIGAVQLKQELGDASHGRSRKNVPFVKAEMTCPAVLARMKQTNDSVGHRINRGDVAALVPIAKCARPRQVLSDGLATVLAGDDVVGLVRLPAVFFMKPAVFAPATRSLLHVYAHGSGDVLFHDGTERRSRSRALTACISISTCSN